jgi:hypothetical protein
MPKESDSLFPLLTVFTDGVVWHSSRLSVLRIRRVNNGAVHLIVFISKYLRQHTKEYNRHGNHRLARKDLMNNDLGSTIDILNTWLRIMFSFNDGRKHKGEVIIDNVSHKGRDRSGDLRV